MAITINDDGVIFDGTSPIIFPSDGTGRASSFLSGFDVNDNIVLGSFTPDRKLRVDASLTVGDITIGDVGVLLQVGAGTQLLSGVLNPDATTYAGYVQDQRMYFSAQNELKTLSRVADSSGMIVNPAQEETLQSILDVLSGTDASAQISQYGVAAGVAGGGSATVASYTVPVGKKFHLRHASASGENIAEFSVNINGTPIVLKKTWFTDYNAEFFLESPDGGGPLLNAGDMVTIEVNNFRPMPGDFNGTIFGRTE